MCECLQRRWLARNPMHMIARSLLALWADSKKLRKINFIPCSITSEDNHLNFITPYSTRGPRCFASSLVKIGQVVLEKIKRWKQLLIRKFTWIFILRWAKYVDFFFFLQRCLVTIFHLLIKNSLFIICLIIYWISHLLKVPLFWKCS